MAFRWCAVDGPTLNADLAALCFFQGFWTSIAENPYSFVIVKGRASYSLSPSGPAYALDGNFRYYSNGKSHIINDRLLH